MTCLWHLHNSTVLLYMIRPHKTHLVVTFLPYVAPTYLNNFKNQNNISRKLIIYIQVFIITTFQVASWMIITFCKIFFKNLVFFSKNLQSSYMSVYVVFWRFFFFSCIYLIFLFSQTSCVILIYLQVFLNFV